MSRYKKCSVLRKAALLCHGRLSRGRRNIKIFTNRDLDKYLIFLSLIGTFCFLFIQSFTYSTVQYMLSARTWYFIYLFSHSVIRYQKCAIKLYSCELLVHQIDILDNKDLWIKYVVFYFSAFSFWLPGFKSTSSIFANDIVICYMFAAFQSTIIR